MNIEMSTHTGDGFPTLSSEFEDYLKANYEIENSELPTNSEELQKKIIQTINSLEKATFMVSEIGLFSDNEVIEELPTSSVKFLLLPYLLGGLALKNLSIPRIEALRLARVYYVDFLKRCKDYDLTNVSLDICQDLSENEEPSQEKPKAKSRQPTIQELQEMARQREDKLTKYREKKALEEQLSQLKIRLDKSGEDSDVLRDYYTTLLHKSISESLEELHNIKTEQTMLKEILKMRERGTFPPPESQEEKKSFKPFLLTKENIKKNVFGLGYPSLPEMSVDEFYEKRVKEGWFPDPNAAVSRCCSNMKNNVCNTHTAESAGDVAEERESKLDEDDPDEIARLRERDEWRDTHRTGWGNTHNRS